MDADDPDFTPSGSMMVKGVLQIPSMVINSSTVEESTKGQKSGHQRRENVAKSTRIIERRGGGATRKAFRKDGEPSSSRNNKIKDTNRTKGIIFSCEMS